MTDKRKVIFISGPMTGYEDYNRAAFNAAAKSLENDGHTVLNPAVLPDGLEHEQYMQVCLAMLEQADEIYMLNGWESSKGARREIERASSLGLSMQFQSWSALRACIASMDKAGRLFMKAGVHAMSDYFSHFEAGHQSSMSSTEVEHCRIAIAQCNHFLMVLDNIGVPNGESH